MVGILPRRKTRVHVAKNARDHAWQMCRGKGSPHGFSWRSWRYVRRGRNATDERRDSIKRDQEGNQRVSDETEKEVAKIQLSGFCVVCGEELLKSSNRPFYYCLNWQDKEAKHTVVKEDDWTNFCAEQCVKTDEPEFQSNIEFDSSGN